MLCHIPETLRARKDPSAVSPFPGIIGRRLAPGTIINRTSINFVFKSIRFQKECQYGFEKWQGRTTEEKQLIKFADSLQRRMNSSQETVCLSVSANHSRHLWSPSISW